MAHEAACERAVPRTKEAVKALDPYREPGREPTTIARFTPRKRWPGLLRGLWRLLFGEPRLRCEMSERWEKYYLGGDDGYSWRIADHGERVRRCKGRPDAHCTAGYCNLHCREKCGTSCLGFRDYHHEGLK